MRKLHITLNKGQKLWFTSDLHFGHRNVIKFCNRPFEDEKVMGKQLINNWNETVSKDDIVFVLGDTFWFNDSRSIKKILDQLNGTIYLIPGNHDDFATYHRVDDPRIHLCEDVTVLWLDSQDGRWDKKLYELWLCHSWGRTNRVGSKAGTPVPKPTSHLIYEQDHTELWAAQPQAPGQRLGPRSAPPTIW